MTNYFVGTQAECDAIVSKLNTFLGYPNETTTTYATPREHFSNPGTWFVPILPVHAPNLGRRAILSDYAGTLTPTELTVVSHEVLLSENAWELQDTP